MDTLTKHVKLVHKKERNYPCPHCKYRVAKRIPTHAKSPTATLLPVIGSANVFVYQLPADEGPRFFNPRTDELYVKLTYFFPFPLFAGETLRMPGAQLRLCRRHQGHAYRPPQEGPPEHSGHQENVSFFYEKVSKISLYFF